MAISAEQYLMSDEVITKRIEDAGAKERVTPLDPDFLLILFFVAIPFDVIFGVLELIGLFSAEVPKLISIPLNIAAFGIICGWSVWRTGRVVKSREQQKKSLQKAITKRGAALEKKLVQNLAKRGMRAVGRRVLIRGAVAVLGGILPLVAFFPFWTLTVILTLKDN